jgi:hypothetical protein
MVKFHREREYQYSNEDFRKFLQRIDELQLRDRVKRVLQLELWYLKKQ